MNIVNLRPKQREPKPADPTRYRGKDNPKAQRQPLTTRPLVLTEQPRVRGGKKSTRRTARAWGAMNIVRIEAASTDEKALGGAANREAVRNADLVISSDNVVLKDRHGHVDRLATEDELAQAVAA